MVPDAPPEVAFIAPPARTRRSHLRLEYEATDDYGIGTLSAVIRLAEDGAPAPQPNRQAIRQAIRPPIRLALPVPGPTTPRPARQTATQEAALQESAVHDLTAIRGPGCR